MANTASETTSVIPSKHRLHLVLNGYYGFGNIGDEAFPDVIAHRLRQRGWEPNITVVSHRPAYTESLGYHAVAFKDLNKLKAAVQSCDVVVTGGGGLFQDYVHVPAQQLFQYPVSGPLGYLYTPMLGQFYDKPTVFFAQGVGPIRTQDMAGPLRMVARGATALTVRDPLSQSLLEDISGRPVKLSADPAVYAGETYRHGTPSNTLGINLRPWAQTPALSAHIKRALDDAIPFDNIVLVPFQGNDGDNDYTVLQQFREGLTSPTSMSPWVGGPAEAFLRVSSTRVFMGMRLHSLIFAASAGTIPIGFAYDPKVSEFMNRIGTPELCLPMDADSQQIRTLLLDVAEHYKTWRHKVQEGIRNLQSDADVAFKAIEEAVENHQASLQRFAKPNPPTKTSTRRTSAKPLPQKPSSQKCADLSTSALNALRVVPNTANLSQQREYRNVTLIVGPLKYPISQDARMDALIQFESVQGSAVLHMPAISGDAPALLLKGNEDHPKDLNLSRLRRLRLSRLVITDPKQLPLCRYFDAQHLIYIPVANLADDEHSYYTYLHNYLAQHASIYLPHQSIYGPTAARHHILPWVNRKFREVLQNKKVGLCSTSPQYQREIQSLDLKTEQHSYETYLEQRNLADLWLVSESIIDDPVSFYLDAFRNDTLACLVDEGFVNQAYTLDRNALRTCIQKLYPQVFEQKYDLAFRMAVASRNALKNQASVTKVFKDLHRLPRISSKSLMAPFFINSPSNTQHDVDHLFSQLEEKDREIASLRQRLETLQSSVPTSTTATTTKIQSWSVAPKALQKLQNIGSIQDIVDKSKAQVPKVKHYAKKAWSSVKNPSSLTASITRRPQSKPASGSDIDPTQSLDLAPFYPIANIEGSISSEHGEQLKKIIDVDKPTIIFPPTTRWGDFRARPHHIMAKFAQSGYQCLFLEPEQQDKSVRIERIEKDLIVLRSVPWSFLLKLKDTTVYISWAINYEFVRYLKPKKVVYDIIDELDVFANYGTRYEVYHELLLTSADVVCYSADKLLPLTSHRRYDACLVPNAANVTDFETSPKQKRDYPSDVPQDDRPIAGYFGVFAKWFDYKLANEVARLCPNIHFLYIGPKYDPTADELEINLPNVTFVGRKAYTELKAYANVFDVALLPFKVNRITQSTSPVKIFEYMAAGKPVVSTPLHECQKYPCLIPNQSYSSLKERAKAFADLLYQGIELSKDKKYTAELVACAKQNDWSVRADTILNRLK